MAATPNDQRIARTMEQLIRNNMAAHYVEDIPQLHALLGTLMDDGATISCGGSTTLQETKVMDLLRSGKWNFLDRVAEGLSPEDVQKLYRQCFSADVYLTSSNAVTTQGELYNVDGNGNRVAAMIFGPARVIVVVGANKIVDSMAEAVQRIRTIAAPLNCKRLQLDTGCMATADGVCVDCKKPQRVCCAYVTHGYQRIHQRVHVIIMPDSYGY